MDRRQRKTREAIFNAFCELLSKKHYSKITVGDIIDTADIGRATFYAHFDTKDFLLKELCEELFCHIFDSTCENQSHHKHIFECDPPDSVFLHILLHIKKNDNNLLKLLSSDNNELFLGYFKENLAVLIKSQLDSLCFEKPDDIPEDFWINHISSSFVQTVIWWISKNQKESAETVNKYFLSAVGLI